MSECVHDFEIGSRYCVHCGQGAAELLYHAKARIALLEKVAVHAQFYLEGLLDADGYELDEALRAAGYGEGV